MRNLFFLITGIVIACANIFCSDAGKAHAETPANRIPDNSIQPTGAIAYIRNNSEIRLIDSTGKNDRQIWTHSNAKAPFGIFDLAWRPDGKELAFSSGHENLYSIYHADLFGILPDGSGLRKITNAPDHRSVANYKKGSVTITLKNFQYSFQKAQSSTGIFTVYIAGADMPQQVLLPPGSTKTIEFKNVADLGDKAQPVVAIYGQLRWIMPGLNVVAGKNTKAPDFTISGDGYEYFGAFRPVWKSDGTQLSYRDGMCLLKWVPVNPGIGIHFNPLFGEKGPSASCYWDWGPTQALSRKVLYLVDASEETSGYYLRDEGESNESPVLLYLSPHTTYELKWLPDGSGFLYTKKYYRESDYKLVMNIFRYDIATKKHTQITDLDKSYARQFSVSPSGKWIVYERWTKDEEKEESIDLQTSDLWIMSINGTEDRLLVKNAMAPSWSR